MGAAYNRVFEVVGVSDYERDHWWELEKRILSPTSIEDSLVGGTRGYKDILG